MSSPDDIREKAERLHDSLSFHYTTTKADRVDLLSQALLEAHNAGREEERPGGGSIGNAYGYGLLSQLRKAVLLEDEDKRERVWQAILLFEECWPDEVKAWNDQFPPSSSIT